mmetsp:Transcript_9778/g.21519  ORF Transcript_9778/g.21519 Transcript_9778/m.21519 type:complete len:129 (-) Transcript_9778:331-717(-)
MRYKMDTEEKTRKEKDRINKLRASHEMKYQSMNAEYDSILDTTEKNYKKELIKLEQDMKNLEEQEEIYKKTSEYMNVKIKAYKESEGQTKRGEYEKEKNTTSTKIKDLTEQVNELVKEVKRLEKERDE